MSVITNLPTSLVGVILNSSPAVESAPDSACPVKHTDPSAAAPSASNGASPKGGRPRTHQSAAEKQKAYRARKKLKLAAELDDIGAATPDKTKKKKYADDHERHRAKHRRKLKRLGRRYTPRQPRQAPVTSERIEEWARYLGETVERTQITDQHKVFFVGSLFDIGRDSLGDADERDGGWIPDDSDSELDRDSESQHDMDSGLD
jgi:hypothetical protein